MHLRQRGDGNVRDGGGTVEYVSEVPRTLGSPQPCEPSRYPASRGAAIAQASDYSIKQLCCRRWGGRRRLVQADLLGEQVADGDVVVAEPVLMLAPCSTKGGQRRRQDCVPQLTPSVLYEGVLVSGGGSDGINDWNVFQPLNKLVAKMEVRQVEAHQTIVDALRQTGQWSHDVVPDGKGDTRAPFLCIWATVQEDGVAGSHLLEFTLFGEPGLAESTL
nr:unnamed protein product [Spirometra erinaceieuropaei]